MHTIYILLFFNRFKSYIRQNAEKKCLEYSAVLYQTQFSQLLDAELREYAYASYDKTPLPDSKCTLSLCVNIIENKISFTC